MNNNDLVETDELNKKADKVEKPEDAATVIKQYEEIIRTKKKDVISIAYHKGSVFKKFKKRKSLLD